MKKLEVIIFLAVVLLAIFSISSLNNLIANINIPFDTDEADHANAGIEFYAAIKSASPIKVVNALQKAAFYPPIHPILVSISYITLSPSLYSSRVVSVFLLISLIFILCKLTIKTTKPTNSLLPITFIILCIVSSPITLKLSALCMLELCAMNCVALFILLLSRYENLSLRNSNLFILCLGTLLVSLSKYSFGIIVIPALSLLMLFEYNFKSKAFYSAFSIGFFSSLLLLAWALFSDLNSFISFLTGHPSYVPIYSLENIFYDIRSWIFEYNINPYVGILITLLAMLGATNSTSRTLKFCSCLTVSALFIFLLSTTNEIRHFMVAAPALWLLAANGFSKLSDKQKLKPILLVAILGIGILHLSQIKSLPQMIAKEMEGRPSYQELQNEIFRNIDPKTPILVTGANDQFSLEALRWRAALESNQPYSTVQVDAYPFRDDKDTSAIRRQRNRAKPYITENFPKAPLSQVLAQNYYKYILVIRTIGNRGDSFKAAKEAEETLSVNETAKFSKDDKEIKIWKLIE